MVHNIAIKSVIFTCPDRTDVRERDNWTYDLHADTTTGPTPMDIP